MVMVFDERGEQVPKLQGKYEDVKDKVLELCNPLTQFSHGIWNQRLDEVSREDW